MKYLSVCSGIEAATVAWHSLDWNPSAFSEIEKFPRELLQHHYPHTPLHGDFTTIGADDYGTINLLVGGTPCQAFSVAGLRKGFTDQRGNLTLEFIRLAQRKKPKWILWENVPGVLSIDQGRAFGSFLGGLAECGYGFAYRVLDAQYFGVPQRRRRVFVVGYFGDWRPAAAVLFERESLQGDITPRRSTGQGTATEAEGCLGSGAAAAGTIMANCATKQWLGNQEAFSGDYFVIKGAAIGRKPENGPQYGEVLNDGSCYTLNCSEQHAIANTSKIQGGVRRFTPLECERLFGFPDNYTKITAKTSDSVRYKALGNSMAVPVMKWLGTRIDMVQREIIRQQITSRDLVIGEIPLNASELEEVINFRMRNLSY